MTVPVPRAIDERRRTNQGIELPSLGLGVFQTPPGDVTRRSVRWALEAGYRLIDTAAMYGNEADVGEAVRESGLPREEVLITTKVWYTDQGFGPALRSARRSHERLGLGPIDLLLIHWPIARSPEERLETWKALVQLQRDGIARAIGVANYTVRHLEELANASEIVPAVDQVEYHPFVHDPDLLSYLERQRIVLEAYSPLTRGRRLDDERLAAIARLHDRTPAQVLLRWGLQHGCVELPKSIRRERIVENARLFDFTLSSAQMDDLDRLSDGGRVSRTDPRGIP